MNQYKIYPKYKDSGVQWLGAIPENWLVTKVKYRAPYQVGWTPPTKVSENFEGENKWVTIGDLNSRIINTTKSCISDLAAKQASMNITPKGSLLFSFKLSVGTVAFAGANLYTNEAIASFLKNNDSNISYLYYASPLFIIQNASENIYGAKILNQELISNATLVLPPLQEQQTIANHLDNTTAKIDTLIEKQTKLIALLKEKRQAVISTAVTRGLDSSVPMKDSGIEWLGKIPKHWRLPQVSRILILMEQGKSPECDSSKAELDEWGVLKTSCVNNAIYDSEKNKKLPSSIKPFTQYEVKEENILMSRASGSIDLIGSVAYVYKTRAKILLSDKIFRLYVDNSVNKIFFTYLMASDYMRTNIKMAISGGEGMANNIAKSSITRFKIALPPIEEQKIILIYIDKITTKIDNLITKSTKAIDLLKEKRTALVSSAVTGKIDVRKAS